MNQIMKQFKYMAIALAAMSLACASCSDDKDYDFPGDPYNRVYTADMSSKYKIIHTPAFSISNFDVKIPAKCNQKATGDIKVTFEVDNNLIAAYNEEHGTNFAALPAEALNLGKMTLTIPAGEMATADTLHLQLTDDADVLASLNSEYGYLLAVKMASVNGGGGTPSTNMCPVHYFEIGVTNDNIFHGATADDLKGTLVEDQSGWSATSNSEAYYGTMPDLSRMFDGNFGNYCNMMNSAEDLTFTVDMGKTYTFDGIRMVYGYKSSWWTYEYDCIKSGWSFEKSDDGANFSGIGVVEDGDNGKLVAFYAPVTTRYIRVTVPNTGGYYGASAYVGEFNVYEIK